MTGELFNWVTMIEVPLFLGLFRMISKNRSRLEDDISEIKGTQEQKLSGCREALSDFKIHVARNYVSINYLKDVENRLTEHLLRIEKKIDDAGGSSGTVVTITAAACPKSMRSKSTAGRVFGAIRPKLKKTVISAI